MTPDIPLRQRRLAIVLLAVVTYACTLQLGLLWDDHVMIELNPFIREWSWANIRHDFTSDAFLGHGDAYYRPAQLLLNRLDYTLWGLKPFGYHLTNLLSHVANAVLVHELILALGFLPLTSLIAATLFAVHPMPVEQLMIIAGRAELFGLTFSLICLIALLRPGAAALTAACLAYVTALFFKESAAATPFLGALLLFYRGAPVRAYGRILLLAALTVPYLYLRVNAVGWMEERIPWNLTPLFLYKAFPAVLTKYLGLVGVPWHLHSHRQIGHLSRLWPLYLAAWLALTAYVVRKRDPRWILCLGLFLLPFLPKIPVMMAGGFMLDHWAYPAVIGVALALGIFFTRAWHERPQWWARAATYGYLALLVLWSLQVPLNVALRGTDEKMYRWALHFTESNPIKSNLGVYLVSQGRYKEALPFLFQVFQVDPTNLLNTNALAEAYARTGRKKIAIKLLEGLPPERRQHPLTQTHLDEIRRQP
jgi:tetratricopeptide (TPR) repeat protein